MGRVADLTRNAFVGGDLSTVMSPRTVITWAENADIFNDIGSSFRVQFLHQMHRIAARRGRRVLPALFWAGTAGERAECGAERRGSRWDGTPFGSAPGRRRRR